MSSIALLGVISVAIALMLFLVMVVKLHAFVTLLNVSLATAIVVGIPLDDISSLPPKTVRVVPGLRRHSGWAGRDVRGEAPG